MCQETCKWLNIQILHLHFLVFGYYTMKIGDILNVFSRFYNEIAKPTAVKWFARNQWHRSGVFIINFELISHCSGAFWLPPSKCQLGIRNLKQILFLIILKLTTHLKQKLVLFHKKKTLNAAYLWGIRYELVCFYSLTSCLYDNTNKF